MSTIEGNIAKNLFEDILRSTPKALIFSYLKAFDDGDDGMRCAG